MRDFTLLEHGSFSIMRSGFPSVEAGLNDSEYRYLARWLFLPHYEFLNPAVMMNDPWRIAAKLPPGPSGALVTAEIVEFGRFMQSNRGPCANSALPGAMPPHLQLVVIGRNTKLFLHKHSVHPRLDSWLRFINDHILREWCMFLRGSLPVSLFDGTRSVEGRLACDRGIVEFVPLVPSEGDAFIESWDDINTEPAK